MAKREFEEYIESLNINKEDLKKQKKLLKNNRKAKFISNLVVKDTFYKYALETLKLEIKQLKSTIKVKKAICDNFSTIDGYALIELLSEGLSIGEREEFYPVLVGLEENIYTFDKDNYIIPSQIKVGKIVITTKENKEKLERLKNSIKREEDIEKLLDNGKYIMFRREKNYKIFDLNNMKVEEQFINNYPYLDDVIKSFIEKKFKSGYKDDKVIVGEVLEEMPLNEKIKNLYLKEISF